MVSREFRLGSENRKKGMHVTLIRQRDLATSLALPIFYADAFNFKFALL